MNVCNSLICWTHKNKETLIRKISSYTECLKGNNHSLWDFQKTYNCSSHSLLQWVMNVHIRVILSICLIIHSSVLLIVINIWSNVDCMIITIEIIIPSTTLHVSLSIRSDTSIHSHPHSMLLLTSTPLILIYLLISVSSIIELDPMLIQSFLSNHPSSILTFIHATCVQLILNFNPTWSLINVPHHGSVRFKRQQRQQCFVTIKLFTSLSISLRNVLLSMMMVVMECILKTFNTSSLM